MNQKSCLKEFGKYVSLNVLGMIGLSCYIMADTFFIAKGLGANGLAALNLAIPIFSFINGVGLMLGMGGATKYSILKGQQKPKEASRVFTNTLMLACVFAAVFFVAGLFFPAVITRLLGANEEIFEMCRIYLKVILLFSPMFLANNILICFVRNDGAPQLSMTAMMTGSFMNIVLDYIFIFPLGMGIFGAVLATGFAPICSMTVLSVFFAKKKNQFHLVKMSPDSRIAGQIFSGGVPSLVGEVSAGVVMIVFNMIILNLEGNIGVAAYGVIANIALVVTAVYNGIAQGIQPILSENYGIGNRKNVRDILKYAVTTVIILSGVIYGGIYFFAPEIAAAFNSEQNELLQTIAVFGLKIYFISCVFAGLNIILSVYFTSTEYALPAHIISLLRGFVIIIPMAFLLSSLWQMTGVWMVFPVTEFVVALIGAVLYKKAN